MFIAVFTFLLTLSTADYDRRPAWASVQSEAVSPLEDAASRDAPGHNEAASLAQDAGAESASQPPATRGQGDSESKKPPTPAHTGIRALASGLLDDVKHLPAMENAYLVVLGAGVAGAAHPFDQTFTFICGATTRWSTACSGPRST